MAKLDHFSGVQEFVSAVEAASLSGAALVLDVSVAHISRKVSALERDLGHQLLLRTPRGCTATESGRLFYQQSKALLVGMEEARDGVKKGGAAMAGSIRVSAGGYFAESRLLPLFARFAAMYPEIDLDVGLVTRNVDLVAESVDLAIRMGPLADSRLKASRLISFKGHTLASPEYLQVHGKPRRPQDLDPRQCLSLGSRPWTFMREDVSVSFAPEGRIRSDTGLAMVTSAREGLGFIQVPAYYGLEDLKQGGLVAVLKSWASAGQFEVYAVLPPTSYVPARVRRLVEFLHKHLAT